MRTHLCGELSEKLAGEPVSLSGILRVGFGWFLERSGFGGGYLD